MFSWSAMLNSWRRLPNLMTFGMKICVMWWCCYEVKLSSWYNEQQRVVTGEQGAEGECSQLCCSVALTHKWVTGCWGATGAGRCHQPRVMSSSQPVNTSHRQENLYLLTKETTERFKRTNALQWTWSMTNVIETSPITLHTLDSASISQAWMFLIREE